MNDVQVFEAVARHIAAQGYRSLKPRYPDDADVTDNKVGAYRGDRGCKCAMGIFIDDDEYQDDMEGTTIDVFMENIGAIRNASPGLCRSLQKVHDNRENWHFNRMRYALLRVQLKYKLSTNILQRLDFGLIVPNRLG